MVSRIIFPFLRHLLDVFSWHFFSPVSPKKVGWGPRGNKTSEAIEIVQEHIESDYRNKQKIGTDSERVRCSRETQKTTLWEMVRDEEKKGKPGDSESEECVYSHLRQSNSSHDDLNQDKILYICNLNFCLLLSVSNSDIIISFDCLDSQILI